jgi:uncharacterized protein YndB with AHSA1/START domain
MGQMKLVAEPGQTDLTVIREFAAPREAVYQAHVDPRAIPQWWGLRGSTTTVPVMDVRPGGDWRWETTGPDGVTVAFYGKYVELVPNERIVQTVFMEGMPGDGGVDTYVFETRNGKTVLSIISRYASVEVRDQVLGSGMEYGANETFDRLEELLAAQTPA